MSYKGFKHSETTKERMRITAKKIAGERYKSFGMYGKKHSASTKEKLRRIALKRGFGKWMLGTKRTEEVRKKMSLSHLKEKNYRWRGGDAYAKKKQVLVKQNYTCKICGHREPEIMEVDRIIPVSKRPDLKEDISNMQVLCPNCHARKTIKEITGKRKKNENTHK